MTRNGDDKSKFFYMPLLIDDWLSSDTVAGLSLEQEAAFLRLLMRQFRSKSGMLPKDEETLARWSRLGARWRKVGRPLLSQCFEERAGGYVNVKCRQLWERAKERSAQAAAAARARWD